MQVGRRREDKEKKDPSGSLFSSDIFICSWVTNLYKISSLFYEWDEDEHSSLRKTIPYDICWASKRDHDMANLLDLYNTRIQIQARVLIVHIS